MVTMRICFVGDSIVNGTGDQECLGWAGRICAEAQRRYHDVTYYNLGIRRDTSADIMGRWRQEVACRFPDGVDARVVFSFGGNDVTVEDGVPRVEFADSIRNTRQILGEAKQSYPVLMVGPPPTVDAEKNEDTARLSKKLGLVCKELEVPYLDVFATLKESGTWIREAEAYDGSHPRAGGYSELAALVQEWPVWLSWFKA